MLKRRGHVTPKLNAQPLRSYEIRVAFPTRPKPTQASVAADRMEDGSSDSDTIEEAYEEGDDQTKCARMQPRDLHNISRYGCII